jgi:hypothetical protein
MYGIVYSSYVIVVVSVNDGEVLKLKLICCVSAVSVDVSVVENEYSPMLSMIMSEYDIPE